MSDIGNIVNWREEARRIDSLVASIARELGWNLPDADLIEFGARVYRAMSLAEKWDEYFLESENSPRPMSEREKTIAQRAFYAGAEAALPVAAYNADLAVEYQAEIDHFRSHK